MTVLAVILSQGHCSMVPCYNFSWSEFEQHSGGETQGGQGGLQPPHFLPRGGRAPPLCSSTCIQYIQGFIYWGVRGRSFPPKPFNFPPQKILTIIQYLMIKTLVLCFFVHWWLILKNGLKNFACFTQSSPQTKNPRWNPDIIIVQTNNLDKLGLTHEP